MTKVTIVEVRDTVDAKDQMYGAANRMAEIVTSKRDEIKQIIVDHLNGLIEDGTWILDELAWTCADLINERGQGWDTSMEDLEAIADKIGLDDNDLNCISDDELDEFRKIDQEASRMWLEQLDFDALPAYTDDSAPKALMSVAYRDWLNYMNYCGMFDGVEDMMHYNNLNNNLNNPSDTEFAVREFAIDTINTMRETEEFRKPNDDISELMKWYASKIEYTLWK